MCFVILHLVTMIYDGNEGKGLCRGSSVLAMVTTVSLLQSEKPTIKRVSLHNTGTADTVIDYTQ